MSDLMPISEIKEKLADRKLKVVAERAGVHSNTLYIFMRGGTYKLTEDVHRKVSDYLREI